MESLDTTILNTAVPVISQALDVAPLSMKSVLASYTLSLAVFIPIRGRMALDGLYVPERAPWYAAFRAELLSFPAGKHDDQVDALGLIGQLLDKMVVGRHAAKPEETQQVGYAAYESCDNMSADTWGL
jgi:hypothetical protein